MHREIAGVRLRFRSVDDFAGWANVYCYHFSLAYLEWLESHMPALSLRRHAARLSPTCCSHFDFLIAEEIGTANGLDPTCISMTSGRRELLFPAQSVVTSHKSSLLITRILNSKTQSSNMSSEDKIREQKDTFLQKLRQDGVVNPQGFAMVGRSFTIQHEVAT